MHQKLAILTKAGLIFLLAALTTQIGIATSIYADNLQPSRSLDSLQQVPPKSTITPSSKILSPSESIGQGAAKGIAFSMIPAPPDFDVKSYILVDANSGYVIAEKNAEMRVYPASLTKLMTLYLAAVALRDGRTSFHDHVVVSENAWRTGGSRMFIKVGSSVSMQDLIKGIVIASGNDATVAVAEHLGGSEQIFVGAMNQTAKELKMDNTNYIDSSGFKDDGNYSTAFDLVKLARAWILNFPDYYSWFKEKWILYNGIKQPNRNRLLWRDPSVDGIKTGHTNNAGYCLIASAIHKNMRLLAVVMGAKSDASRTNYTEALLSYGFRFFETYKLFTAGSNLATSKVLLGKQKTVALGLKEDLYVTLPGGQYKNLKAKAVVNNRLKAPINKDKIYGTLNVVLNDQIVATRSLVALQDNAKVNFIFGIFDYILMLFQK